ncbi:MAG: exodeoxyribonuclease VII small subunit [Planctomycetota bacterium]
MASLSYEDALAKIQEIAARLESGDMPLEESIKSYEQALKLIKTCYEALNKAEKKLQELSGSLDDIKVGDTEIE